MYKITNVNEIQSLEDNRILINKDKIVMNNSKIIISGKDNIVFIEDGCSLLNTDKY